ncbi:MAG: thioredoxin domain-containing protein, partial [Leptospiraceae bacterium]|nr:thioredoxin domain-containing protein [Leptospiraceae bacterium]
YNWKDKLDFEDGGALDAPKFAMPITLEFLLRYQNRTKDERLAAYLKTTLKKIAFGGIHDIVVGGFARYSVDAHWKVPHFEKMLYDNAQLLTVYAQAYQITNRPMYKSVCYKILDWINEEMTDKSGGIYAALDADSEGIEGKFYCWNYDEFIQVIVQIDNQKFNHIDIEYFAIELYNITKEGNFENGM